MDSDDEQRYLAIKNSNRFTSKFRKGGEKATSYLSGVNC